MKCPECKSDDWTILRRSDYKIKRQCNKCFTIYNEILTSDHFSSFPLKKVIKQ